MLPCRSRETAICLLETGERIHSPPAFFSSHSQGFGTSAITGEGAGYPSRCYPPRIFSQAKVGSFAPTPSLPRRLALFAILSSCIICLGQLLAYFIVPNILPHNPACPLPCKQSGRLVDGRPPTPPYFMGKKWEGNYAFFPPSSRKKNPSPSQEKDEKSREATLSGACR